MKRSFRALGLVFCREMLRVVNIPFAHKVEHDAARLILRNLMRPCAIVARERFPDEKLHVNLARAVHDGLRNIML